MMFSNIMLNKINTGYIIFDILLTMIITSLLVKFFSKSFKNKIYRNYNWIKSKFYKKNTITFKCNDDSFDDSSNRFRAIMFWVSHNADSSVRNLIEKPRNKWNNVEEGYVEIKIANYRVNQTSKFNIDNKKDIYGQIYWNEKSKVIRDKVEYIEYFNLDIYSYKLNLIQLQEWIEEREKEYQKYLRSKSQGKQLLVEVSWNIKDNDIDVSYNEWHSNVTFNNRFFNDKDLIVQKINWFLTNPKWYQEKGIPYTLGFLLWGEPGCGKTGFIKALMNLTGRHGVDIKLSKKFDMNKLKEVIYKDDIGDDLIISPESRILIFEDIDCMSEIVKDRDLIEKEKIKEKKSEKKIKVLENEPINNNLSYFLNILDGLQECPGRIIVMTTNKPEYLDKALIRPGRIDFKINFTNATTTDVKNMVEFYWNKKNIIIDDSINLKYTHAQITNFCRSSNSFEETLNKLLL